MTPHPPGTHPSPNALLMYKPLSPNHDSSNIYIPTPTTRLSPYSTLLFFSTPLPFSSSPHLPPQNPLGLSSKQPHIRKDEPDGQEEAKPDLPAHARLLGHAQHARHGAPEADARVVEGIVHAVGEGGGGADLVADGDCDLWLG